MLNYQRVVKHAGFDHSKMDGNHDGNLWKNIRNIHGEITEVTMQNRGN